MPTLANVKLLAILAPTLATMGLVTHGATNGIDVLALPGVIVSTVVAHEPIVLSVDILIDIPIERADVATSLAVRHRWGCDAASDVPLDLASLCRRVQVDYSLTNYLHQCDITVPPLINHCWTIAT